MSIVVKIMSCKDYHLKDGTLRFHEGKQISGRSYFLDLVVRAFYTTSPKNIGIPNLFLLVSPGRRNLPRSDKSPLSLRWAADWLAR
jgi:hypothetical protein